MTPLYITGAVQAFFLSYILYSRGSRQIQSKFLIGWMLMTGGHLVGIYLASSGFYRKYPEWWGYDAAMLLLQGPCLLIYILLSTSKEARWRWHYFLHFIPFLFFTAYVLSISQLPDVPDREAHIVRLVTSEPPLLLSVFGVIMHFHLIIYLIVSWVMLRRFSTRLSEDFSFYEDINLPWLRAVVIGLGMVSLFIVIGLVVNDVLALVSHDFKAYMIFAALAVLPFYFTWVAINNKIIYPYATAASNVKYEESSLSSEASAGLYQRIEQLMIDEKPFLNGKLSLNELADLLQAHPKHVSQAINENFQSNFFNFINTYRVEEVKQRINSGKYSHYSLLGIGLDCGFNTKSSFNTIFKKFTGVTPSDFKKGTSTSS